MLKEKWWTAKKDTNNDRVHSKDLNILQIQKWAHSCGLYDSSKLLLPLWNHKTHHSGLHNLLENVQVQM